MTATTIIFVRHGETLWNKEGRYQGQQDSPLSQVGLIQVEQVGQFLRNRRIQTVYSSDLKRAWLTAESIAKHHQLSPVMDSRLREMSFGVWEGKTREQVKLQYPDLWDARGQDTLGTRIPGGELPSEVVQRFKDFLEVQVSESSDQTIVVVSHGGALRLIIASLLHIPLEKSYCLHQSNAGVSELKYVKQGRHCSWEALYINRTVHVD